MPIPLLPIIAGGAALAGVIGGALTPSGAFSAQSVTPDTSAIEAQLAQLRDPNFGLQQFLRTAQQGVPTQQQFFERLTGLGGSLLDAEAQFKQARSEANERALSAQGQFSLGAQQSALQGGLGLADIQQRGQLAAAQSRQQGAQAQGAAFDQLLGGGLGILGNLAANPRVSSVQEQLGGTFGGVQSLGIFNQQAPVLGPQLIPGLSPTPFGPGQLRQ